MALFIVLALTAAQSARLGAAALFVQFAQDEVELWTSMARTPGRAEIRGAARYFSDSLEYAADNPWALEGLGAMDLARLRVSRNPREALAVTQGARAQFRQALRQRPTSPFLWANLALANLYLDEIDAELLTALRYAIELGPWEPTVQETTLFVGLAVWQELDPGLRQALELTIKRGATRNPHKIFKIVKSYTRFELICAIEEYRRIAGPDCSNMETARPGEPIGRGFRQ